MDKENEKTQHAESSGSKKMPQTPLTPAAEARRRTLYLLPLDIVALIVGALVCWDFGNSVLSAISSGQVQLFPKVRHTPPETVSWPKAWALFLGAGWLCVVYLRYLWARTWFIVNPDPKRVTTADGYVAFSIIPAGALYIFSGWLARPNDALKLAACFAIFALPLIVWVKFGKRAGVATILLIAATGIGMLLVV